MELIKLVDIPVEGISRAVKITKLKWDVVLEICMSFNDNLVYDDNGFFYLEGFEHNKYEFSYGDYFVLYDDKTIGIISANEMKSKIHKVIEYLRFNLDSVV